MRTETPVTIRLKDYQPPAYWIKNCAKMEYKSTFRPLEMLLEGKWLLVK
jgi:arginyl-tRNA--protein-N-Asp/Glu arginylyltransferase